LQLQKIETKIYEVRGLKVMLDYDLAELYQVPTKALNQAVKRNNKRFPTDFMFQLTKLEWETMRSQIVTASNTMETMQSQNVTASQKKRNVTALPYAFTEQGLAMLSTILQSEIAIEVNVALIREHESLNYENQQNNRVCTEAVKVLSIITDFSEIPNYSTEKIELQIKNLASIFNGYFTKQPHIYSAFELLHDFAKDDTERLHDPLNKALLSKEYGFSLSVNYN
jgi:hypothetical protein